MVSYQNMIRSIAVCFCSTSFILTASIFAHGSQRPMCHHSGHQSKIKNIIVIVPDGCNQSIQTISRWYKGAEHQVDQMTAGTVRTWSANSVITGSAAAASAFATGFKVDEPFISVGPAPDKKLSTYQWPLPSDYLSYRPLATVLEGAKAIGKATGIVATATISQATPAAQAAHVHSRKDEQGIIEQQVYQDIDVVFGGGKDTLTKRVDRENLLDTLQSRGYQWVETRDEMLALTTGKVWGLFSTGSLQPEVDRAEFGPDEPSLAEMTQKAIELLSQNSNGFFLFVEASQVDFGSHNDDPIYCVKDFLAFDEAVNVAVEFARNDGHTAVLAFPDHNCGGMSIGSYYSDKKVAYDTMSLEYFINPLKTMRLSSVGIKKKIADTTNSDQIKEAVLAWWNIALTDNDVAEVLNWPYSSIFSYKLAAVVSKNYTGIGWTTHGHDGSDVPIWTYNCEIGRTIENVDIAARMFGMFNIDSKALNEYLFVDVDQVFSGAWALDSSDVKNKVLVITQGDLSFRLPISKDEIHYSVPTNSTPVKKLLCGVVVYAPKTKRVYVPHDAVDEIREVVANSDDGGR